MIYHVVMKRPDGHTFVYKVPSTEVRRFLFALVEQIADPELDFTFQDAMHADRTLRQLEQMNPET